MTERPDAAPPKEKCTCPEGLETYHGPAMKRFGRGFDRDCPVHGMEAMGLALPPANAAPVAWVEIVASVTALWSSGRPISAKEADSLVEALNDKVVEFIDDEVHVGYFMTGSTKLAHPRPDNAPSDEAKLAFIKAHTAVMGEWEVTDGWEEALDAGLRAYDAVKAHPRPDNEDAPLVKDEWEHVKAESTEAICLEILKVVGLESEPQPFDLLNCVAGYAMRCEEDGRSFQRLIDKGKSLEVKCGFIPDRRSAHPEDAPGGPWEICHHYEAGSAVPDQFDVTRHHGLDTISATKAFTWAEAIAVRDALNREVRDRGDTVSPGEKR